MGFNMAFAPVCGLRPGGESPQSLRRITGLGAAYVTGVHDLPGFASVCRCFPGAAGSAPSPGGGFTQEGWLSACGEVYRALMDTGVDGVLVSGWGQGSGTGPAALLRVGLGFQGVIICDTAPLTGPDRGELLAAAVNGGCDMLLCPGDIEKDFTALLAAYRDGVIREERINDALTRILGLKAQLGLNQRPREELVPSAAALAAILGAPRMRHDITMGQKGSPKSYAALVPQLAEYVREIADYAQSKGVLTMTENHGFFSQDSERVELLYNTVNHPNFALLCDIGNFTCADEDPAKAVARVAPYVKYVHAKDFIIKSYYDNDPGEGAFQTRAGNYLRGTVIGHGNVPVKQCLHILKKAGYDGTTAIEFEGMEPALTAIRVGLANLKRYWEEA